MTRNGKLAAVLVLTSLLPGWAAAAGKCERLVATGSPDAPPYLWRDPADPRHLIGANADLLRNVATQLGLKIEFLYAGKRSQALDEVRSGRMDLLADSPLNTGELERMDFIHPPIAHNEIVAWVRRSEAGQSSTLADLQGHSGAISERTRVSAAFEPALHGLALKKTQSLTPALQMLARSEVEYVLAGRYAGTAVMQSQGLADLIAAQPVTLDRPGLYLGLSFDSACNDAWLRGQLSKKMTELAASGAASDAIQRNLERWKTELRQAPGATDNQEKRP